MHLRLSMSSQLTRQAVAVRRADGAPTTRPHEPSAVCRAKNFDRALREGK